MSKMAELAYDIEQLYIEGLNAGQIARELNCPKQIVLDWIADQSLRECEDTQDPWSVIEDPHIVG